MTSANVTNYNIYNKNGKLIKIHSQSHYCRPNWTEFLVYQPVEDYFIEESWCDEEEVNHEGPCIPLRLFLLEKKVIPRLATDPPEFKKVYLENTEIEVKYCCDGEYYRVQTLNTDANIPLSEAKPVWSLIEIKCKTCDRILYSYLFL